MAEVKVETERESYDIHIGAGGLSRLGLLLPGKKTGQQALVVTDTNVGALYGAKTLELLGQAGIRAELITVPPGEDSKSAKTAMALYTKAITQGLDRKSFIVALGGGVVGDLAGFIAATYLRGIPFVQVPTSLLAQVDSSVGGKVAINHELGKNLIGAFYQPVLVLIDTDVLTTLPERELYAGLAEVIKYGIIGNRSFFSFLTEKAEAILAREESALTEIIALSCRTKAEIVGKDEREEGIRITLNFGHTIGHAIEACTGFERYNHGEAVAIGMHGAMLLSRHMGLCGAEDVTAVRELLLRYRLPIYAPGCREDELMAFIQRDKKVTLGKVNWVLVKNIGETVVTDNVPEDMVRQTLTELTAPERGRAEGFTHDG